MKIADDLKVHPSLKGMKPEMTGAFSIIDKTFESFGYEAILTSGTEGVHSPNSLHPKGLATDWRTKHMRIDLLQTLASRLKKNLGGDHSEYDVVLESDHVHIEFDPK